jgi:hypothetical protein
MAEPVIIQFDDDDNYHAVLDLICFNMNLNVTAFANSVESGRKLFERIEKGELKPTIAIVNSFLERDLGDGAQIAKKLRELVPDIKIIAFTIVPDETWADVVAMKSSRDQNQTIIKALEKLTGHEFKGSNVDDPERG